MAMGTISTLSPGEAAMCSEHSLTPRTLSRTWEYWSVRLAKVEAMTARPGAKPAARTPAKASARRKATAKSAKRAPARPATRKANRAKKR
jgi:hypothetical protein